MAKCPFCKASIPLHALKCVSCPAEFTHPQGWHPIPVTAEEEQQLRHSAPPVVFKRALGLLKRFPRAKLRDAEPKK